MIRYIKFMGGLLLAGVLAACGGGGGSPGSTATGGTGGTTTTGTVTVVVSVVNASGTEVSKIDSAGTYKARATVSRTTGPVAGSAVTFSVADPMAVVTPTSALTNSNGVAEVTIAPALGTKGGATRVTASVNVDQTDFTGFRDVEVGAASTVVTPAKLEIFSSSSELSSAPNSSVTFTVVAKDANNIAMPNQVVTFSATSGNLQGASPPPSTGAAGQPITSVSLTPGADRSNRTVTVTVTAGTATQSITLPVTGTKLTMTGNTSLLLGGQATYTLRAVDSAQNPIPNATIAIASSLNNARAPATVTTDSQGNASFVYTATNAGSDTLTASGLGTSVAVKVSISNDLFQFDPLATNVIAVNAPQTVAVRFQRGGQPVVGQLVNFSTTRGTVTPVTALTDSTGRAFTTVNSTSSGPATIVAQIPTAQASMVLTFVAVAPVTVDLQANPGASPPNSPGSTTNQITLVATVRDAAGNPVANRTVNFTAVTDPSNGQINPGTAVTDSAGQAQVQFIPGGLSTANNGVVLSANVAGTAVTGTAALTVNAQALFISIATGNTISNLNEQTYQKDFSVYVTDANGAPAGNRVVTLEVFPVTYLKGTLTNLSGGTSTTGEATKGPWHYASVPTGCPNEDVNRNGILNAGEDMNGNGKLDPGLPVIVSPASVTTAANGFATFTLFYGENYALWVDTVITARASVGGTESVKTQPYFLAASAPDMNDSATTPANAVSPFGTVPDCSVPN